MIINSYAICAPGLIRTENQDNLYVDGVYRHDISDNTEFKYNTTSGESGMFAVADGLGGGKYGDLASLMAVEKLSSITESSKDLSQYLLDRNDDISDLMDQKKCAQIGSTFAGIYIKNNKADIINIGDSRIYLYRNEELVQLSRDHTVVQQMVDHGIIDKDAARTHSDKHRLTQYLGTPTTEFIIEPFVTKFDVQPMDVIMLCTDGLTDMLNETEIKEDLIFQNDISVSIETLYTKALSNGGRDNITILLLQLVS